jgi:hypothetical protein
MRRATRGPRPTRKSVRGTAIALVVCTLALADVTGQGRMLQLEAGNAPLLDVDHPRLAFAPDGSFAVAMEILTQEQFESQPVRKVAVQRYSPQGNKVGPLHKFTGESCSSLDMWLFDYMSHPEIAFRSDGILVVMMQHSGRFVIGTDDVGASEVTIAAINASGEVIDLNNSTSCVQHKVIFVGSGRGQERPRMALSPDNGILLTADGFFNRSDFRNVGIRVLDSGLQSLFEQGIPHDDLMSESSFHAYPDIATNGTIAISTWHRCPMIDNQGNANQCHVEAQFITSPFSSTPQTLGGNVAVSLGSATGSLSIWPSAAMNAHGASVIVWADTRNSPTGEIFAQRFDASGQMIGGNFQICDGSGAIYFRPEVALLDDGRFMVAWTDSSSAGFSALARRYAATGQAMEHPTILSEGSGLQSGRPAVAAAGTDFQSIWLAGSAGSVPHAYTSHAGVMTTSEKELESSTTLTLSTGHPNPFSSTTEFWIDISSPADASVTVYDVLGRAVQVLLNQRLMAGRHSVSFDASILPPGIYIVRLTDGRTAQSRLVTRVR